MANTQVAKRTKKRNKDNIAYLFVLPFVIVFLIFSVYPVLRTLYLSFTSYRGFGDPVWIWLDNYKRALTDKFFWRAFWNTCKIWGVNIIVQLGLAFLLTIIFSDIKYKMRGLPIFRAIYYLPNLIAATSVAFLFKTLLDWRFGSVNQILVSAGITSTPINWMGDASIAPYVISIIGAWMWFGNSFIVLMAGVQGIPTDYFEAAAIDGAGRWTRFFKITLPLLKPILLYTFITSLIGGLQLFDLPYLMAEGGTLGNPSGCMQTAVMYLFRFGFETGQVGFASAIAYTLFIIILILSVIQFKWLGGKED